MFAFLSYPAFQGRFFDFPAFIVGFYVGFSSIYCWFFILWFTHRTLCYGMFDEEVFGFPRSSCKAKYNVILVLLMAFPGIGVGLRIGDFFCLSQFCFGVEHGSMFICSSFMILILHLFTLWQTNHHYILDRFEGSEESCM